MRGLRFFLASRLNATAAAAEIPESGYSGVLEKELIFDMPRTMARFGPDYSANRFLAAKQISSDAPAMPSQSVFTER